MKPLIVNNTVIGKGVPKICVPIVGATAEEVLQDYQTAAAEGPDLIEWRADCLDDYKNENLLIDILHAMREGNSDVTILFTLRTEDEGGKAAVTDEEYQQLNQAVIRSGFADMIDVESSRAKKVKEHLLQNAHLHSMPVIMSKHYFESTPDDQTLKEVVAQMAETSADIYKLAVMPKDNEDVVRLLLLTEWFTREYPHDPIVTVSMSGLGLISRISGEVSGSAITFASASKASAPGQIDFKEMKDMLDKVHQGMMEVK